MMIENNKDEAALDRSSAKSTRFYVRARSVNAVRRALYRAPGGARVVGRFVRDTIECQHTMDCHSYRRHWPVIASPLENAGLVVIAGHQFRAGEN
ncbi:MAG: hypothetical protein ACXVB5_22000, partial [Isosphaeraceae bacterium]